MSSKKVESASIEMKNLDDHDGNISSDERKQLKNVPDELDSATRLEISTIKHDFYKPIFIMLFAFTAIGVPFNFCFDGTETFLPPKTDRFILVGIQILCSRIFKVSFPFSF